VGRASAKMGNGRSEGARSITFPFLRMNTSQKRERASTQIAAHADTLGCRRDVQSGRSSYSV
jgi:hypothetical protein